MTAESRRIHKISSTIEILRARPKFVSGDCACDLIAKMDAPAKSSKVSTGASKPSSSFARGATLDKRDMVKSAMPPSLNAPVARVMTGNPVSARAAVSQPVDLAKKAFVVSPHLISTGTETSSAGVPAASLQKIVQSSPGKPTIVPLVLTPGTIPSVARAARQAHVIPVQAGGRPPLNHAATVAASAIGGGSLISPGTHISALPVQIAKGSNATVTGITLPKVSISGPRILASSPIAVSSQQAVSSNPSGAAVLSPRPTLMASVSGEIPGRLTIGPSFVPLHGLSQTRASSDTAAVRPTKTVFLTSAGPGASTMLPVSKVTASGIPVTVTNARSIVRTQNQTVTLLTTVPERSPGNPTLRPSTPVGLTVISGQPSTVKLATFPGGTHGHAVVSTHVTGTGSQVTLSAGSGRIAVANMTGLRTVPLVGESRSGALSGAVTSSTQTPAGVHTSPTPYNRLPLSPRPSILRKRDGDGPGGSPAKRALLLSSVTSSPNASIASSAGTVQHINTSGVRHTSLSITSTAARPPSPVDGDSNSSSTLSATSSPDMGMKKDFFEDGSMEIEEGRHGVHPTPVSLPSAPTPSFHNKIAQLVQAGESRGFMSEVNGRGRQDDAPSPLMASSSMTSPSGVASGSVSRSPARSNVASSPGGSGSQLSPRKKPRKQQLQGMELKEGPLTAAPASANLCSAFLSTHAGHDDSVDDMMEAKQEASDEVPTDGGRKLRSKRVAAPAEGSRSKRGSSRVDRNAPSTAKSGAVEKKKPSLLASYKCNWNPRHNHFVKAADLRAKEEKKMTVSDLASQKLAAQKAEGFSLVLLDRHVGDLDVDEMEFQEQMSYVLDKLDSYKDERLRVPVSRLREMVLANHQRSSLLQEQYREVRDHLTGLLDHKTAVAEVMAKFASKRSARKRDK